MASSPTNSTARQHRNRLSAIVYGLNQRRVTNIQHIASVTAVCSLILEGDGRGVKTVPQGVFSFSAILAGTPHIFFVRIYRMSHFTFMRLAENLALRETRKFRRSCPLQRLSVTLRWLAGGSYLDIALAHNLSTSTVYHYIDGCISLMNKALQINFPYRDVTWLRRVAVGFSREGRSALNMCCGALDGLAVKISEPAGWEVANSSKYYNRKGFFAINTQAMCDSKYRFTFVSCCSPGSTHDSTAFAISNLSKLLEKDEDGLLRGFWIAADDAYTCMKRLLTPWPGRSLSISKDGFNYWQSSARIYIEQAFGILVSRWGVLWRPLRCTLENYANVIVVCCKLHNYIIDNCNDDMDVPPPYGLDNAHHTLPADIHVYLQDECEVWYRMDMFWIESDLIDKVGTKNGYS